MSSPAEQKLGVAALRTVLQSKKNIDILNKQALLTAATSPDVDHKAVLYQLIGELSTGQSVKKVFRQLKTQKIGWSQPCFDSIKASIEERQEFILNPYEVEEGVLQCRGRLKKGPRRGEICGSWRTYSFAKQTKSSDEGTNVYAQCVACGNKWTHHG